MRESVFQSLDSAFGGHSTHGGHAGNIGTLLLDAGKLTPQQAEQALNLQRERGIRFGEAAVQLGFVRKSDIEEVLAVQFDYPYLQKGQSPISDRLVAAYQPFSETVEALRSLRTQLTLRWFSAGHKSVMFASHDAGESCSLALANLAIVFSQLGERTLIVDGNLRRPRQHALFGLENQCGLSDILAQRADLACVQKVNSLIGLHVLSAGAAAPNPQELLGRPQLAEVLDGATRQFDIVLVDTAPMKSASDAQLFGPLAKGVVLVLRKNQTQVRGAEKLNEAMKLTSAHRLGVILAN